MQYVNKTFTLPVTSKRMSQTEYEIAVGLRKPDGTLAPFSVDLQDVRVAPKGAGAGIVYHFKKPKRK